MRMLTFRAALLTWCLALASTGAFAHARGLSLDERIRAQTEIERVYWRHRLWPVENRAPKPQFETLVSALQIRAEVDEYLRKSVALDSIWSRPITTEQLQAEMARIARESRQPEVLEEIYTALGHDPLLVAECLARPLLADRLLRNWYAFDDRFHGDLKRTIEAALAESQGQETLARAGAQRQEVAWRVGNDRDAKAALETVREDSLVLTAQEWDAAVQSLRFGQLIENADRFTIDVLPDRGAESIRFTRLSWPKRSFEAWWEEMRPTLATNVRVAEEVVLPAIAVPGPCTDNTWGAPIYSVGEARQKHTAVWTGSEMIVWGGSGDGRSNTGGRYTPATDSWAPTSLGANVPSPRLYHSAVWTGTEMIVWGGEAASGVYLDTGGRYNPSTDTWTPTSTGTNLPAAREIHTAIWTGSRMIVWGGESNNVLNTGGAYDPSNDTWTPTSVGANVPVARFYHTAVWTGSEMIVWGGYGSGGNQSTGGRYRPSNDSWTPTGSSGTPPRPMAGHVAVWTGAKMIVWDGSGNYDAGGRYDPLTDSWTLTTSNGVPQVRSYFTAVWTGSEMIVWGGHGGGTDLNSGGRYNPTTDLWSSTGTGGNVPEARSYHTAVWTGSEMIVWGGVQSNRELYSGGRYNPSTNGWLPTSTGGAAATPRKQHTAVWTGSEMIVWGGTDSLNSVLAWGGRYRPSTNSWTAPGSNTGQPIGRIGHTAIWTGTEMIIWGGRTHDVGGETNTGSRYNPATSLWTPTSGSGTPSVRSDHSAVWTGREMVVWGGLYTPSFNSTSYLNSGGRYDPAHDTWASTSSGTNVPERRANASAVWTGERMIVWGGRFGTSNLNTGALYDPAHDAWTPTSTGVNVPAGRSWHTAVWTGERMIVWGGASTSYFDTGGVYDPSNDTWTATSVGNNLPAARYHHTAVWTGDEMIVWGGYLSPSVLESGGRYRPSTDSWTSTSKSARAPAARQWHTGLWTGSEMIVWGGEPLTSSGGRYCAVPSCPVATWYRDSDADGFWNPGDSVLSCAAPAGFVASEEDCDDSDSSIHPGAEEICDLRDDNCDGTVDEGFFVPVGSPLLMVAKSGVDALLSWSGPSGATAYDIVTGSVSTLHLYEGNFYISTTGCLANDLTAVSLTAHALPSTGDGLFYLVRGVNCRGPGTYDTEDPSQVASRDNGIAFAPAHCP